MRITFVMAALAMMAQGQSVTVTTLVAGRVVTAARTAVPGSYVWLLRERGPNEDAKKFLGEARNVATDPQGQFGFFDLKPGWYKLCAVPEHVGHWANCQWGEAPVFELREGEMKYDVPVTVGPAVRLRLVIQDDGKLRAKAKDDEKDPMAFSVLLTAEGRVPVTMRVEKDDEKELVYSVLAPGDRDLKIKVASDRGKFVEAGKDGVEAEGKEKEYLVKANDGRTREVTVKLKSIEKVDRGGTK
jgi:hypothetical protein